MLKNIPKIQCKGNNNEKNSCGSKKSPSSKGLSLIFFFSRKCHTNTSFLSLIYVFKNVKQGDTLYIHVWFSCLIAVVLKMKKWSSQWTQFMQLRKEAWKKKFRTSTGFEPMISRYRCDALPTELWSHWQWEQVNCGFIFSSERNECNNIFVVPHLVSKTLIITKVVWQFCIWLRWRSKGHMLTFSSRSFFGVF